MKFQETAVLFTLISHEKCRTRQALETNADQHLTQYHQAISLYRREQKVIKTRVRREWLRAAKDNTGCGPRRAAAVLEDRTRAVVEAPRAPGW